MRRSSFVSIAVMAAIVAAIAAIPATALAAVITERASVTTEGAQAWDISDTPAISSDGRFVAFRSQATTLVAGDTNGFADIFLRDRTAGTIRVSVSSTGTEANGASGGTSISGDGRFVVFTSAATNLVAGGVSMAGHVFIRDVLLRTTELVSVSATGTPADKSGANPSVSNDGRFVVFACRSALVTSDTNGLPDVFVRDRLLGTTERVGLANDGSQAANGAYAPAISGDGRFVTFESKDALVPGDTNDEWDVYIRDLWLHSTQLVSVATNGAQGNGKSVAPSISADGRYVAFESEATTLVAGDTNGKWDVFVRDRLLGVTERVSLSKLGGQADNDCYSARVSADGRCVAFASFATNLVDMDTTGQEDVFVRDRLAGKTQRVSVSSAGDQGNGYSAARSMASISGSGRFVAYDSAAANLVPDDTNGVEDIFVSDRGADADLFYPPSDRTPSAPGLITTQSTGKTFAVFGYVIEHTAPSAAMTLQFYRYESGHWVLRKSVSAKETDASMADHLKYSATTSLPSAGKWRVRARHKPGTTYLYGAYQYFAVLATPSGNGTPSTPSTPSKVTHGIPFAALGYVSRHPAGTSPVKLYFYRKQSGHWVLRKTISVPVANYLTFSAYPAFTSVSLAGSWRVRAGHKVGSHNHYSGYRTFTAE